MARIRSIKPEFAHSESMGKVSRDARLLFVLMWTIADDSGRLRGCSRMLASLLFPYDDDAPRRMDGWVGELEREGCIVRYKVDGSTFIEIRKWASHQKIDHPSPSRFPPLGNAREDSREVASDSERSPPIQSNPSEGESTREGAPKKASRKQAERPEEVELDLWSAFLANREAKSKPLTPKAWQLIANKIRRAGVSIVDALTQAVERGWADWGEGWGRSMGSKPVEPPRNVTPSVAHLSLPHVPESTNCQCDRCCSERRRKAAQ